MNIIGTVGLWMMSVIQIGTSITMFTSIRKQDIWNILTLPSKFSTYRYMLSVLWLTIGLVCILGAIFDKFRNGALLLSVINSSLEISGYWISDLPRWYQWSGTFVMFILLLLCGVGLINS